VASTSLPPASWTVVAETGTRFASFSPYAPSLCGSGAVAFQAALVGGGGGVFVSDGRLLRQVAGPPDVADVTSHPDVNDAGDVSFYGVGAEGFEAVWRVRGGRLETVADARAALRHIGPAGPTIAEDGTVAFRATLRLGREGVFAGDAGGMTAIAETGSGWSVFHGLPVAVDNGVVFRAERDDGTNGIYAHRGGGVETLVETGEAFLALGLFPSATSDGTVGFAATLREGGGGVFTLDRSGALGEVMRDGVYESYRGALISRAGVAVAVATPYGGSLGLFAGPDPVRDRVVALGDPVLGSRVVDLAANPVSANASGQLALRLTLADGRQLVVRVDPA
jgi:hypothetical protein